jgi:chemotaxis response regulator CheB
LKLGIVNDSPVAAESRRRILRSAPLNHLLRAAGCDIAAIHLYCRKTLDISHHPSVDGYFFSMARNRHDSGTTILLTGKGASGSRGLSELPGKSRDTIAQDARTSLCYGMHKAAVQLNAADTLPAPDRIGSARMDLVTAKKGMFHG